MKILLVSTSDIDGGAARAAYNLHRALLSRGLDSQMLVQNKTSDDYTVVGPSSTIRKAINKIRPILDSIPVRFYKNRTKTLFSPACLSFSDVVDRINKINPDIVHLHWVCGGMIRLKDVAKIKVPIVWSLHDMWTFTGGCHYSEGCIRYKNGCGKCKILGSDKLNDLSRKVWKNKQKAFLKMSDLVIVGQSRWLEGCAKESSLLKIKKIINLPSPVDANIFKSFDVNKARELWNLPQNKKLIIFGAMGATSDPRKGFLQLEEALAKLEREDTELVVFGGSEPKVLPKFGFKIHYLGRLHDSVSLKLLYNSADLVVVPSLEENLSNVILESLACGVPVVAFDIGGNSDMINHQINGYLAKPFDTADLARGIDWILDNNDYESLCKNARSKVLVDFDMPKVADKYKKLYESILENKK